MEAILLSFEKNKKGLEFLGELSFTGLFTYVDERRNLFPHDTDEEGNKCEPYITDEMGTVVSTDDCNSETGEIDFDPCDRYYTIKVSSKDDLSIKEIEAIRKYPVLFPNITAIIREPKENIHTLEEFAQYLNDSCDYPMSEVDEIIKQNGWEGCEEDCEFVCRSGDQAIEIGEKGKFEVKQI